MEINVTTSGTIATIHLHGRFEFNGHRAFKAAYDPLLQQAGITVLAIDLAAMDYLDSSALGMLLMLRERAQAVNKGVTLCKPNQLVMQILDIANFAKLFTIS